MVANCGGRDKVIVIINQNGEDPPIVQQQQQDKHRGHGQSGAEWRSGPTFSQGAGRRKRVAPISSEVIRLDIV